MTFPDVRWGKPDGLFRRLIDKPMLLFMNSRIGKWIHRHLNWLDKILLRVSKGRINVAGPVGLAFLQLTTIGCKSGQPRTHPLIYIVDGAEGIVLGSNYGQTHHPAWTANLLANPNATVEVGAERFEVRATLIEGSRRDELFQRMNEDYANYEKYKATAAGREFRMFALRRV
ncbi:nitroreductase family deazaflavin-dependent oxidoreductase [Smaragdicoccus niigatensis]|uniref:nitroreductase family deazaflavin-dependent oxidoreductase n=1 Tax=Smaragdicoccus niigatensis TaxID=359359 RepID=UPI0003676AF4|nr:nitroreductase family deazaflavin-dependent oxidoreductase [Smaragdicoccus niigatensis]